MFISPRGTLSVGSVVDVYFNLFEFEHKTVFDTMQIPQVRAPKVLALRFLKIYINMCSFEITHFSLTEKQYFY